MANLAVVTSKVQSILAANFTTELDEDGFTIRYESARMFIEVQQNPDNADGPVFIRFVCPILFEVEPSPAVFEHIALHADDYRFGHLSASKNEDGSLLIFLNYQILGDFLDEEELTTAVTYVLSGANDLDDELQQKFGGRRFHED